MKKNLKVLLIKEIHTLRIWICMISLSILLFSCQKTKYPWQPGISSPKYFLVTGNINFGIAGNGSWTAFDSGWGNTYGAVVSGDRYKDAPKEVDINYFSVVDRLEYSGNVPLPQDSILNIFKKYNVDDNNSATLIVGMAPGGWIRVWVQAIDRKTAKFIRTEVAKAKLKGHKNENVGIGLRTISFEEWKHRYIYWQHFGIPYEAWAENEKEYDLIFDFHEPNNRRVSFGYVSLDGTFYQRTIKKGHQKLPSEIEMCWLDDKNNDYCCKILLPKNFKKYIERKKIKLVNLRLEIEKDNEHATLYLVVNNQKEKLMRFKSSQPTEQEMKENEHNHAQEVEYYIE